MNKKVALVTGGTSGVGLSIVRALVARQIHVHFIGRNAVRGAEIAAELNSDGAHRCDFVRLDLSHLADVRMFATRFRNEVPSLDLLLNVAGLLLPKRQVTTEGFEKTFAIGYLSAVLLTTELIPSLERAPNARVLNVGGVARLVLAQNRLDLTDLAFERNYSGPRIAIDTIHAKAVFSEILADRLRARGVDVNAFHPGAVRGELGRSLPKPVRMAFALVSQFLPRESKSGIRLSTAEELTGVTGRYFVGKKSRPLQFDAAYKAELWAETERMLSRVA